METVISDMVKENDILYLALSDLVHAVTEEPDHTPDAVERACDALRYHLTRTERS